MSSSTAIGGEARPADQAPREAWPGGRRPGPEGRAGVAQAPPHEGDYCEFIDDHYILWL